MKEKPDIISRKAEMGEDGVFVIPIKTGSLRESIVTHSDIEDAEWEPYDYSIHEAKQLTYLNPDNDDFLEEEIDEEFDPNSKEQINQVKEYITHLKDNLDELSASGSAGVDWTLSCRSKISDLHELIRYQLEAFATEADDEEIRLRGNRIWDGLQELLEEYDNYVEQSPAQELEQEDENTRGKRGWWSNDFQKNQGVVTQGVEGDLRQVWGDQEGPIGFEPPVIEKVENTNRAGWWQAEHRARQGVSEILSKGPFIQRGEVRDFNENDEVETENPKHFVAYPLPGGKRRILMSATHPERFFPEAGKKESLDADRIKEYRDWVEPNISEPIINNVGSGLKEELLNSTYLSRDYVPTTKLSKTDLSISPEFQAYGEVRERWLDEKKLHETKQKEYISAVEEFYNKWAEEVKGKSFFERNVTKYKSMFGHKPDLPPEIVALRDDAQASAELLHRQSSDELLAMRGLVGKRAWEDVPDAVKERYFRRFSYEYKVNQKEDQLKIQKNAIEQLGFEPNKLISTLLKNKNYVKVIGAGVVGVAVGSLLPALWAVRSVAGATAAAGAASYVSDKLGKRTEAWKKESISAQVAQIVEQLKRGNLSKEDIVAQNARLDALFDKLNEKERRNLYATLAAAGVSGVFVGGAAGAMGEGVLGIGAPDPAEVKAATSSEAAAEPARVLSADINKTIEEANAALDKVEEYAANSQETAGEAATEAVKDGYVVEKGDNLSDILEGETKAGSFEAMKGLSEADEQEAIVRATERLNEDAELREKFGMGDTADLLYTGEEIDKSALNELLAEEIKAHSIGAEASDLSTDSTEPPAGVDSGTTTSEADATQAAAESGVEKFSVDSQAARRYAVEYQGGYGKFTQDLQAQWIDKIQGPAPQSSALGSLLGIKPGHADFYKTFGAYSAAEIIELAKLDRAVLETELAETNIRMKDYDAWASAIAQWQEKGLVIKPQDRFSDVVETVFIKHLEATKK